jgi:hypothetical protein
MLDPEKPTNCKVKDSMPPKILNFIENCSKHLAPPRKNKMLSCEINRQLILHKFI